MYPEKPDGTQVIFFFMSMRYDVYIRYYQESNSQPAPKRADSFRPQWWFIMYLLFKYSNAIIVAK